MLNDLVHTLTGAGYRLIPVPDRASRLKKRSMCSSAFSTQRSRAVTLAKNLTIWRQITPDTPLGYVKRNTAMRHRDWLSNHERRLQIRKQWEEFFHDFDIMLMPVQPRDAIEHDHSEPV